jgi:hypothetical protein
MPKLAFFEAKSGVIVVSLWVKCDTKNSKSGVTLGEKWCHRGVTFGGF